VEERRRDERRGESEREERRDRRSGGETWSETCQKETQKRGDQTNNILFSFRFLSPLVFPRFFSKSLSKSLSKNNKNKLTLKSQQLLARWRQDQSIHPATMWSIWNDKFHPSRTNEAFHFLFVLQSQPTQWLLLFVLFDFRRLTRWCTNDFSLGTSCQNYSWSFLAEDQCLLFLSCCCCCCC